jgi:hypothetical protein
MLKAAIAPKAETTNRENFGYGVPKISYIAFSHHIVLRATAGSSTILPSCFPYSK